MSGPPVVPRLRVASARGRRKPGEADLGTYDNTDEMDDNDQADELKFRVRDHGDGEPPPIARKNRIGGILKEAPAAGLKNLSDSVGEAVKRPLSSIFRRPGSRSGRPKEEASSSSTTIEPILKASSDVRSMSPTNRFQVQETNDSSRRSSNTRADFEEMATAPHITPSQLHGLLQVDALAAKHPNLVKLDDIDISLLTRFIASEEETRDEDIPWTWDTILASTSSEMKQEWSNEDDSGEDEGGGGGVVKGGLGGFAQPMSMPNF